MARNPVASHAIHSVDPRLDWAPQHDLRSLQYAVSDHVPPQPERERLWLPGHVLDQGREGACVGFGWTAEAIGSPWPDPYASPETANTAARWHYRRCKQIDEWPGEAYEGTSVLAGAKVAVEYGYVERYLWCFSTEDIRNRVCAPAADGGGPVVIGVPWHRGMYSTGHGGRVIVSGEVAGGHCLLINGYRPRMRFASEAGWVYYDRVFRWRNSWGPHYGINGHGWITEPDLAGLLATWGEACAPINRKQVRLAPR